MPSQKTSNLFLSNSFFIFITRFFPSLANLLVMIWYSKHLSQGNYGTYQLFWIQLYVIYPLICFGIHTLTITYSRNLLANILSRLKRKHYVLFLVWLTGLSGLFGWMQYYSNGVSSLTSFLFILTFSISVITESLLIVFRKYGILSVTSLLYAALFCAIHWIGLRGEFSLQLIFSCLLIINLLRVFTYSCAVLLEIRKDADGYDHQELDIPAIRSLWLHLGVYDIVQMLSNWIDKFVISILLSAELSAIYYNGAQNVPFLPLLLSAAGSAVLLQLADSSSKTETENTISLVNRSGEILSCIVFPVFCFLFLFRNEIFVTLFSSKYIPSISIFALAILALPVRAYSFTTVLQRRHKGNIINVGAIGELVVACALMYPLYLYMGLPGVALSFVISTYLQAIFYLLYTGRLLSVSPLRLIPLGNWLLKLIIFAAALIGIHYMGSMYFTGKFTLILGAVVMVLLVGISLIIELKRHNKHGRVPKPASFEEY
jgi:O-antigen/teichoic acid export membrane protein